MITKFCDQTSVAFVCHLRVTTQVRRYEIVDIYLGIFDGDAPYDSLIDNTMIRKFCSQISVALVCHLRVISQVRRYEIFDIYLEIFDGDAPYDFP
ncbi:hypothetical protein [Microcoleus sp. bin38.metabat.b11b12b14.051]|uniref:hypothetical protein n=1 Tax=Microcoleus sp. bin38.metabat.b11b12b14.051 TaxID=2742709 RepID=UPI0025CC534D|nr:hypothetical protein [Microcoleus sp. bin38.metabat.b11b12b14.051]